MSQSPSDRTDHDFHEESMRSAPLPRAPGSAGDPPTDLSELPTLGFSGQAAENPSQTAHRVIGDYELLEEIARGGMGIVFKARHANLHRLVALKMILGGQTASPQDVQRFRSEAEEAANLDHPNIVPIYEVGEYAGQYYFTMKLMEGGTLAEHLTRFTQDLRAAVRLLATVAYAVHHAHQHGILHRDLKPGNILLDAEDNPHVTDFGLAKRLEGPSALTQTGAIVGTLNYMAPEQAGGQKTLTTAADIHSLGAILFELLTGRPPFQAATPLDTALAVIEKDPPPPRQLNPRVPRDLETICLKCLEKDPARRYGSADALARDLERWLAGEPIRARRSSVGERLVKWARRRPAGAALVLVILLAAAGMVVGGIRYNIRLQEALAKADNERQRAEENALKADSERRRAEDNALKADSERQRAEENAAQAKRQQAEAAANFQKARDAVDNMLTRVAEGRLVNLSRMESVRLELLQEALKFYQGFLQEKSDDPTILQETGRAHRRVGDVCRLVTRLQQSEAAYRQALAIQGALASRFSARGDYRNDLAITQVNLAGLLKSIGRGREAQDLYREAVALQEKLAADFPAVPEYRQRLATSQHALAQFLTGPDAEKAYRQALAVQQQLVAEFPQVADYSSDAASTLHTLAGLLRGQNQPAEARQYLEEAYRLQRNAIRINPGQPAYWTLSRNHYLQLATVLAQLGDHAALVRLSAQLLKDSPENPDDTYNAACYLGRAIPLLVKDAQVPEAERRQQTQAHADRAMVLLQEAVQKGYRNPALAARDPDLDPLREREEFKKLLVEMEKRPAAERSETVAREYQGILQDYRAVEQAFLKALGEAKTPQQQKEAFQKAPNPEVYAHRFLELASANPRDVVSVDALNWILVNLAAPESNPVAARAVEHLTRYHVQSEKVGRSCLLVANSSAPVTEALFRAVLEKNPYRSVQGQACVALARRLKKKADDAEKRKQPSAALFEEADKLYERVRTQYGDVKIGKTTLADSVRAELDELRNLRVGKVAPEIEGEDLDGKPMKLSDSRGQIVVLVFWANWCGYCRDTYPQARELVKRHAGKPFVLLGVNNDGDRTEIKNVVGREHLNWRSWWDGESTGRRIGRQWNVQAFPTIYVLDAKGVIRYKALRGKALDEAVALLLQEMDSEARKTGK